MQARYRILNICAVPYLQDAASMQFNHDLIVLSKKLNTEIPSIYELRRAEEGGHSRYSLPHCSIMHFLVPIMDDIEAKYAKKLNKILGQIITIKISNLEKMRTKYFRRDDLILARPAFDDGDICWASVEKNPDLLAFQEACVESLGGNVDFLTPQKENYRPHFTLWVKSMDEKNIDFCSSIKLPSALSNLSVRCEIVLGDCGPIGQLDEIICPRPK